jgi:SRSO17 transposase
MYALGIVGDGERKSIEPIAARACPDAKRIDATQQRLLHFAVDSPWSDRALGALPPANALDQGGSNPELIG